MKKFKVAVSDGIHNAVFHEEAAFKDEAAELAEDEFRETYGENSGTEIETHVYPAIEPPDDEE